jgi:hypothetical protein
MKFKYTLSFLIIGLMTFNLFGQSNDNLKIAKYKRVSEAYGYIIGQEYTLNLIKKEFPKYELQILHAAMSFNSSFGKSIIEIKKYLTEYLGQIEFNIYNDKLTTAMKDMLGNQTFSEEDVTNYISEIENRAKGNIASTVLETILSFQFLDRPQDELTTGFTSTFKTKGHPKAKNTDWQIKVPKSWKAEEADRPNIIQKFISDFGSGNNTIMILVKDMPLADGHKLTNEELNEIFTEKEMKSTVPEGGKFISFTKMIFDNYIGGMIECEQSTERLDYKINIRMVQFTFIKDDKMYILQGVIGSINEKKDLSKEMKKYLPLYKLVANSIVVNDQYK